MLFFPYYGFGGFIFILPAVILALYAQFRVKATFNKYMEVPNRSGKTGAETAREILDANGLREVPIYETQMGDHYHPKKQALYLSTQVFRGRSVTAMGVAAHEAGHALQHAQGYVPIMVRTAIAPVASFASQAAMWLILAGLFFGGTRGMGILFDLGIIFFSAAVLFQIITLPVEYNASHRAVDQLYSVVAVGPDEERDVKKVLRAAALTYVAAAAVAAAQLLRLLMMRRRR